MGRYAAVVYWPAPHNWDTFQFCELYSMNIPLFYPRVEDLLLHTEWPQRLLHDMKDLPPESWQPPPEHWSQAHPFSPWWVGNGTLNSRYVQAGMYWARTLRYYTWPHVQIYQGLPHLFTLLETIDRVQVSQGMR